MLALLRQLEHWKQLRDRREKALEDVINGLSRVIEAVRKEDRYPVEEYLMKIRAYAYETFQNETLQKDIPAHEEAFHLAEQWIETLSQIGVLQKSAEDDQQKKWIVTDHQQDCHIMIQRNTGRVKDSLMNMLGLADILITSQHPILLDRLLEAVQVPYWVIQWTLRDNLDIPVLGRQIYERTGRPHFNATQIVSATQGGENTDHVEYRLYDSQKREITLDPITVALTSSSLSERNKSVIGHWPCPHGIRHDSKSVWTSYGSLVAHKNFKGSSGIECVFGSLALSDPRSQLWINRFLERLYTNM
jgi:hypothetical protein